MGRVVRPLRGREKRSLPYEVKKYLPPQFDRGPSDGTRRRRCDLRTPALAIPGALWRGGPLGGPGDAAPAPPRRFAAPDPGQPSPLDALLLGAGSLRDARPPAGDPLDQPAAQPA